MQVQVVAFYSLRRQVSAINKLADAGMFFWDYGNAFLLEASRAGEGNFKHAIFMIIIVYVWRMLKQLRIHI